MKDEHDSKTSELNIKPTAKTSAERQADYRKKTKKDNARVDTFIPFSTSRKLGDMCDFLDESKKDLIARLIEAEYKKQFKNQDFENFVNSKIGGLTNE